MDMEKTNPKSRLNELPDTTLHHILSFLDMKQAVHTSLLSTRWRYLWTSVQTLSFDHYFWKQYPSGQHGKFSKPAFIKFVERVLLYHDLTLINKLHLNCSDFYDFSSLNAFLRVASMRRVSHICIDHNTNRYYNKVKRVLNGLLSVSAVKSFEFNSNRDSIYTTGIAILPDCISSARHLKTLRLVFVQFPKENLGGEFTLKCPVLEELVMKDCDYSHLKSLNICTPQLKILDVRNTWVELITAVGAVKVNVYTPSLASMRLRNFSFRNFFLENSHSLASARIELTDARADEFHLGLQEMLDQRPDLFTNLRRLVLITRDKPCSVRIVSSFLSRSPYMESLCLDLFHRNLDRTIKMEDSGLAILEQCMFNHLKHVEIENFKLCEIDLKLLELLMKNSATLKDLTLTASSIINPKVGIKDFRKMINSFPRASSALSIYFYLN